jgi:hypothetical protein
MHPFEGTISVVGPIVGAIMVLTIFFRILARFDRPSISPVGWKGLLDKDTPATIHLSSGTTLENVRLRGFTDSGASKAAFPFELHNMAILEQADGRRLLIPARLIRMIEIPPEAA